MNVAIAVDESGKFHAVDAESGKPILNPDKSFSSFEEIVNTLKMPKALAERVIKHMCSVTQAPACLDCCQCDGSCKEIGGEG